MTASGRYARILALAVTTVLLLLVLEFLPAPDETLFWTAVFNAGHAPLFGLFALVALGLLSLVTGWSGDKRWWLYLIAFGVAVLVGTITELIQFFGLRDADVMDSLRDLAGSFAFLVFYSTLDGKLGAEPAGRMWSMAATRRVLAVMVMAVSFLPVATSIAAYQARNAYFPVLSDYGSYLGGLFLDADGADVEYISFPGLWEGEKPGLVAHVTFYRWRYPRLTIKEPYPDWSGHDNLVFTVFSEVEDPVRLDLYVEDSSFDRTREYRFRRALEISPGVNRVTVPVAVMEDGGAGKGLDLTDIREIHLVAPRPEKVLSLYVGALRLE